MADHKEIMNELLDRFPGWMIWYGRTTGKWLAMSPQGLPITGLLQSETPEALEAQIIRIDPVQALIGLGQRSRAASPWTLSWRLDEEPRPVQTARRLLRDTLDAWQVSHWRDDATVVVSELTTNSAKHGAPPIALTLSLVRNEESGQPELVVGVTDASTTQPAHREPGDTGGFGMTVLNALATITVHVRPGGKTIQARLPKRVEQQ
jgi:hypothetical protein